ILPRHLHSPAPATRAAGPRAAAKHLVEEIRERRATAEEILEILLAHGAVLVARTAGPAEAARRRATQELLRRGLSAGRTILLVLAPTRPQLVVQLALLGVGEHLVGLVDFLEARF